MAYSDRVKVEARNEKLVNNTENLGRVLINLLPPSDKR